MDAVGECLLDIEANPLSNAQKISSAFDSIPDATAMRHP